MISYAGLDVSQQEPQICIAEEPADARLWFTVPGTVNGQVP